jgi:hypothetical protein
VANKGCIESKQRLNVNVFKKPLSFPRMTEHSITGKYGEQLGKTVVNPTEKFIRLMFAGIDQVFELETTPCNYGGLRYWFLCPSCGTRRGVLYFDCGGFECRECADLNYRSQQHTKTDCSYYNRKAEALGKQLDKGFEFFQVSRPLFPTKPKYMKWSKYRKLELKYYHYMNKGTEVWLNGAMRVLGR